MTVNQLGKCSRKALAHMETFRTERGTYRVPRLYLVESKSGYYVGGEYMGLEDHRRTATAIELESTFRMLLLRKWVGGNPEVIPSVQPSLAG